MPKGSWDQAPERGSRWAARFLLWCLDRMGHRVVAASLPPIAGYFVLTGRRSRNASLEYLDRLFRFSGSSPKPNMRSTYHHHLQFARCLFERVLLWQGKFSEFRFSGYGREVLDRADGRGVLIVGSHLGSFDFLRVVAKDFQKPVHVVMYRAHAQRINSLLREINPEADFRVLEIEPGNITSVMELKACVDRGEHIAILADRHPPGAKKRSCRISFLGHEADFPESPWALATVLRCPVAMAFAVRTGSLRYEIAVEQLPEFFSDRNTPSNQCIAYVRRLESLCVAHPYQWFNFYDFWDQ